MPMLRTELSPSFDVDWRYGYQRWGEMVSSYLCPELTLSTHDDELRPQRLGANDLASLPAMEAQDPVVCLLGDEHPT